MKAINAESTAPRQSRASWEDRAWCAGLMRINCCLLLLAFCAPLGVHGREIAWRNDGLDDGETGYIQAGFVNNDIGVAVFDPPCGYFPLQIKRVQIFFQSDAGLTTQVATHLRVYQGGPPVPGPLLYTGEGGIMNDGFLNDFAVSDLGWVINQGPFAVGVEYVTDVGQPVDPSSAHLTTDGDGCQPGMNLIFDAATSQWFDACALGMSGDFIIRVIFEPMGTGCFGDYDCDDDVDLSDFIVFQTCYTGSQAQARQECLIFDCDADGDVDLGDFTAFQTCFTGSNNPCNPACASCASAPTALPVFTPDLESRTISFGTSSIGQEGPYAGTPPPPDSGPEGHTLLQVAVLVAIVVIATAVFVGPCIQTSCRRAQSQAFHLEGRFPNSSEMNRIRQALDWLRDLGDPLAEEAWQWYSTNGAYNSEITGTIKVNRSPTPESGPDPVASRLFEQVVVHKEYVTGARWDVIGLRISNANTTRAATGGRTPG